MVKHIPNALLLALLVATPVMAQLGKDWSWWREYLLGPGSDQLMTSCATGRAANKGGVSYFDPYMQKLANEFQQKNMAQA